MSSRPHRPRIWFVALVVAVNGIAVGIGGRALPPQRAFAGTASGAASVVSVGDGSVLEGDTGTRSLLLPVSLSRASSASVSVSYTLLAGSATGAATAGTGIDFNNGGGVTRTLTFAAPVGGETAVVRNVSVPVYGDTTVEPGETFSIILSNPTGGYTLGRAVGTGTILNDDASSSLRVGVGDAAIVEGDAGTRALNAEVSLSKAPGTAIVTVPYTVQALSATWGKTIASANDFGGLSSGTLTFTGTTTTKLIAIPIYGDTSDADETLQVTLGSASGASIIRSTGTLTTFNDDSARTSSSTALSTNQNPSGSGQPVTLQAAVSGGALVPQGVVEFFDGSVPLGKAILASGRATFVASGFVSGSHRLHAVYSGDLNFTGSTSPDLSQVVQSLVVFNDEFNGTSIDLTKWTPSWFNGTSTSHSASLAYAINCWNPANITFPGDGAAHLALTNVACRTSAGENFAWTGAGMESLGHFTTPTSAYRYEVRAKLPKGWVSWPGIWSTATQWPQGGEFDVAEGLGNAPYWHTHYGITGTNTSVGGAAPNPKDGQYHTYAVDVRPGAACSGGTMVSETYSFDGLTVGTSNVCLAWAGQFLILSIDACTKSWCGTPTDHAELDIEYVRVSTL